MTTTAIAALTPRRRISAAGTPSTRWDVLVVRDPIYEFSGGC